MFPLAQSWILLRLDRRRQACEYFCVHDDGLSMESSHIHDDICRVSAVYGLSVPFPGAHDQVGERLLVQLPQESIGISLPHTARFRRVSDTVPIGALLRTGRSACAIRSACATLRLWSAWSPNPFANLARVMFPIHSTYTSPRTSQTRRIQERWPVRLSPVSSHARRLFNARLRTHLRRGRQLDKYTDVLSVHRGGLDLALAIRSSLVHILPQIRASITRRPRMH